MSAQTKTSPELLVLPLYPVSEDAETDDYLFSSSISCTNEIAIVNDESFNARNVIELAASNSKLTFYTMSKYPLLAFQMNSLNHFIEITLVVTDNTKVGKSITLSNRKTKVVIDETYCNVPLEINEGWQYLCIDINKILHHAYRTIFLSCNEINVTGNCKIARAYFQEKEYSDIQLPKFLQVLQHEDILEKLT